MATNTSTLEGHESTVYFLNRAVEALNLGENVSSITPAKTVFGSASVLLGTIKVRLPNLQQ